jgi:hypothetical protein
VKLQHWPRVGFAQYGTVLVQWYVMHSHERRLPGSIIDGEFEVCFELMLSVVVLAKRRLYRGCCCGFICQSHIPGGAKEVEIKSRIAELTHLMPIRYKTCHPILNCP